MASHRSDKTSRQDPQAETLERWGVSQCDAVDRSVFNAGLSTLIEIDCPASEDPERRLARLLREEGEAIRRRLEDAVALARAGERAHRTDDLWPHGLVDELDDLLQDLEAHDAHEAFARSAPGAPSALAAGLKEDHGILAARLEALRRSTRGYEAPAHACAVWRLLYVLCLKVDRALAERMRLEDAGIGDTAPQSYGAVILSPNKVRPEAAA
ncbi:hypothetical protein [Brevundimonas viscosa]|uniref:Uncharacterized protein n=1 Tax=Brevundimonas viscosa TaxID=871741 RepID=A0A1I6T3L8_9CAUL|nr:hypothetical protein [Brevundimonas viscosa]SFS83650.1 hypothetical protein SAMN05192570_2933 [Brevundimonas viscosa]